MGIDAEILIRYRGERPTDAQLSRWSWDLCNSVGASKFFTSDGLPPDEYGEASRRWREAFNAHPAYARFSTRGNQGNFTAREEIVRDIGEHPQCLRRAIELTNRRYPIEGDDYKDIPPQYWAPGLAWTQDGDSILAEPGETLLEVSLWSRYYGVGYERGDLLGICAICEWIETNMQPCEVWYGGDSSGVLAEPFPEHKRAELRRHLYSQQGRDYFAYFDERGSFPVPKPCGLCVPGENRFNRCGFGPNYVAASCGGCGKTFETRDNGSTWEVRKPDA